MANKRRIAINTGGGDAPGLNAVIRAVVLSAMVHGYEVVGIKQGYRGLIQDGDDGLVSLDRDAVRGITHLGGTILGSTNRGDPFKYPTKVNGELKPVDVSEKLVRRFKEMEFEALIALGGDGSMSLAKRLLDAGLPRVIGVPKTIDNDMPGTDLTFGFQTAVTTATEALDKLHSTAQAHQRVMVVEVMGRYAGWIGVHSGIAGSADVVLVPEIPYNMDVVCEKIMRRERRGRHFSIVVVAEGAKPEGGELVFQGQKSAFREHQQLGGIAERVAKQIQERTGKESRSLVLGHLQRGGSPVMADRLLSLRFGTAATRFLVDGKESGMVALRNNEMVLAPLVDVTGKPRLVDPTDEVVQTGRDLGICFGDEPVGAFARETICPVA